MQNDPIRFDRAGRALVVLVSALLVACGTSDEAEPPTPPAGSPDAAGEPRDAEAAGAQASADSPLAGTSWRLVEFQSMDDAQGVTRIDDPSLYTLDLDADGTARLRLNCNSATGSWSAEASTDPASGTFSFGPLAATMAVCPPPSFDERFTALASYVRGYLLRDGRLYLSLMADGGIFAWEPAAPDDAAADADGPDGAVPQDRVAALEAAILAASPSYTRALVDAGGAEQWARYVSAGADLDGDGSVEVFVYMLGSIFCGTGGCELKIFAAEGDGYVLIDEFAITRPPVIVAADSEQGWHSIWRLESGGGAPAEFVESRFDGQAYQEQRRIPGSETPAGTVVLEDVTFEAGTPLRPGD